MGALATAGAVLAGCAPKAGEKAAETTAPPPGGAKVTVFTGFGTGTDAAQIEVHDSLVQEFNGDHPDIQMEWLTVPWGEHVAKYSTMLAAGMTPEMAGPIGVGGVAEFMGGWVDLSPFIEADKYDMSDYFASPRRSTPMQPRAWWACLYASTPRSSFTTRTSLTPPAWITHLTSSGRVTGPTTNCSRSPSC
jgi:ABC-type glycerol-3-phosphate transport system substrate-binding protein